MKKSLITNWIAASAALIAGTLLHFVYEWIGGNVTAVFGAVNESTWEHLKLLFWPMFVFGIVEFAIYGRRLRGFIPIKVISVIIALFVTVSSFYTYTGILGYNFLIADIATFVLGIGSGYAYAHHEIKRTNASLTTPLSLILSLVIVIGLIVCFALFTFYPPNLGLFVDPTI